MSEGKSQSVCEASAVARRIRFLRGALSQEEFAAKVGVSRAALANYETGRTVPRPKVIKQISDALSVSPDFLTAGEVQNLEEFAVALGLDDDVGEALSADEWAVIRILGVCNSEAIISVTRLIVDSFKADETAKGLADYKTVVDDLSRLITISSGHRAYQRSVRKGSLEGMMAVLKKRMDELLEG